MLATRRARILRLRRDDWSPKDHCPFTKFITARLRKEHSQRQSASFPIAEYCSFRWSDLELSRIGAKRRGSIQLRKIANHLADGKSICGIWRACPQRSILLITAVYSRYGEWLQFVTRRSLPIPATEQS